MLNKSKTDLDDAQTDKLITLLSPIAVLLNN